MSDVPAFAPGSPPAAADLGALAVALGRGAGAPTPGGPGPGLAGRSLPSGRALRRVEHRPIWGLLAGTTSPYTFTQKLDGGSGLVAGPRTGTAYEVNAKGGLAGKMARLYPDGRGGWRFGHVNFGVTPACTFGGCSLATRDLSLTLAAAGISGLAMPWRPANSDFHTGFVSAPAICTGTVAFELKCPGCIFVITDCGGVTCNQVPCGGTTAVISSTVTSCSPLLITFSWTCGGTTFSGTITQP